MTLLFSRSKMSSTSEQAQTTVEATAPTETSTNTASPPSVSTDEKTVIPAAADSVPAVEEQKSLSSWFNNFTLSPNLSSQLTNISSSLMQVTSKVTAAANNLVQKSLPQRPSTPTESENVAEKDSASSEEQKEGTEANKDLTSTYRWIPRENSTWLFLGILTDLSSTVMKSAQQLKHAVEEKSLLGNFTKEHEKFLTEKRTLQRREEAAVPPWVGYVEEEDMKKQILALSKVIRSVLRIVDWTKLVRFSSFRKNETSFAAHHRALIIISIWRPSILLPWPRSTSMKIWNRCGSIWFPNSNRSSGELFHCLLPFHLLRITEEAFWCNYFYRVSLIKQSTQLSALTHENGNDRIFLLYGLMSIFSFFSSANSPSINEGRDSAKRRGKY